MDLKNKVVVVTDDDLRGKERVFRIDRILEVKYV